VIDLEDLLKGEWYDGFLWRKGKQVGTETLKYLGHGVFLYCGGGIPYCTDPFTGGFEPNIISVGEPAS